MHPKSAAKQRWVSLPAIADHLGLGRSTLRAWAQQGRIRACQVPEAHYTDERPRRTRRATWRVYEADLRAFLARMRRGKPVTLPDSIWR